MPAKETMCFLQRRETYHYPWIAKMGYSMCLKWYKRDLHHAIRYMYINDTCTWRYIMFRKCYIRVICTSYFHEVKVVKWCYMYIMLYINNVTWWYIMLKLQLSQPVTLYWRESLIQYDICHRSVYVYVTWLVYILQLLQNISLSTH